jgi:demethylmenaquinone methyltransferase/2-methoxy-6-polyprenyl-1,4-benzoquinol methylase
MSSLYEDFERVLRPMSAAESYYNLLAPWYDFLAASEKKFVRAGLKMLRPQQGEYILEIGFGTGYAQRYIADAVKNGFSAGVDISPGMAQIARKKLGKPDSTHPSGLVINNSLPLPFLDSCFDGIFSSFTLELFDTPLIPVLLQECLRVLKPAGRLVFVSLSRDQTLPWSGRLYEKLHNRYPRLLDCRPLPVLKILKGQNLIIRESEIKMMWGLPVIIVEAHKNG